MITRFEGLFSNEGFDQYLTSSWQMVPYLGRKAVELTSGEGLTVRSQAPNIATVEEVRHRKPYLNRLINIRGVMPGTTCILASSPKTNTVVARLDAVPQVRL